MALCRVADVQVVMPSVESGPALARVSDNLVFEVTLDVAEPLPEDVVFQCFFVVDASDSKKDVLLESIDVGSPGLPKGVMKFTFESDPPTQSDLQAALGEIQKDSPLEVSGIYLAALYRGEEFCRVGYYVRHEYDDPALQEQAGAEDDPSGETCKRARTDGLAGSEV
eukprot:TRINITY_DN30811_c0_g1_i2.p1 TRINITY_DN30811_c0_g1~~TRINITY_DN30811_c0_g1_i2.p1  ORF type:complete len:167 (+),score=30.64 TRINITY_DN30811_c0_g1_i2:54-554(+)